MGAAALRYGAHLSVLTGSAVLGGAGLAALVALVAGLLPATGLTALASLTTGATTHGASRPGRQR